MARRDGKGSGKDKPVKTVSTPVGTGAAEGVETTQPSSMTSGHSGRMESEKKPE